MEVRTTASASVLALRIFVQTLAAARACTAWIVRGITIVRRCLELAALRSLFLARRDEGGREPKDDVGLPAQAPLSVVNEC